MGRTATRPRGQLRAHPGALSGWAAPAGAAVALALLVAYPLAELVLGATGEGSVGAVRDLLSGRSLAAIATTVATSLAATAVAVVIATASAIVTERTAVPGRRALRVAVLLPLLVPPYVSALSWARAYGPTGLTDRLTGVEVPGVFGLPGIVAVIAVNAAPLAYLLIAASLASRAEPDLERAARASGAGAWASLRTVTLPLLRPALLASSALVFVTSANNFGVPSVLGRPAGVSTVTTRIYEQLVLSAQPAAFTSALLLATLLVLLAVAVIVVADVAVGVDVRAVRTGLPAGGATDGSAATPGARRRWPAALLWTYLALAVALPLVALTLVALTRALGLPPTPGNWTLANFSTALDGTARAGFANSLRLALASAVIVPALGAMLVSLRRRLAGRVVASASLLTFAVPGSALAIAVLLAYGGWLRDTLALILVAYVAKLWALGHRTLAGAVDGVPDDLVRAARASGSGPATAVRTVWLPLLRPSAAAAALVVFLFAFHEITMSALLYGPGTQTLAVVILNLHQLGDVRATSALAVVLLAAVLLVVAPLLLVTRRARRERPAA